MLLLLLLDCGILLFLFGFLPIKELKNPGLLLFSLLLFIFEELFELTWLLLF